MNNSTYYIDNVLMHPFTAEDIEPVTLNSPPDGATDLRSMLSFSWIPASTGGVPTAYDIYLEATEGPVDPEADPTFLWAENVPASSYTATVALEYASTYIWKVVAKNIYGVAPASAVHSFSTMDDPTVYTLPWTEGFETGNAHASTISGWFQKGNYNDHEWTANNTFTDFNRSPKTGTWNAYLRSGSDCWMFKPVQLQAGIEYRVTL